MSDLCCPSCYAASLREEPIHCTRCGWSLTTLAKWRTLSPVRQGWVFYMESSWPTSELAQQQNPYEIGSKRRAEFCRGEMLATRSAQDGEE